MEPKQTELTTPESQEVQETQSPATKDEPVSPAIEELVQRMVEKATAKLGEENKRLTGQLEKLKKEKLTAEEAQKLEFEEKERLLQEREWALKEKENREYALKAIKMAGLDDGSDRALTLVDFVMAGETEAIDGRVKAFCELFQQMVKAEVDSTFRRNGREPHPAGSAGAGEPNPYAKESWNFTAQNELELRNPQEAQRLRELAGAR